MEKAIFLVGSVRGHNNPSFSVELHIFLFDVQDSAEVFMWGETCVDGLCLIERQIVP